MQNLPPQLAQELETVIQKIVRETVKAELEKATSRSQPPVEKTLVRQVTQSTSSDGLSEARNILQRVMQRQRLVA